MSDEFNFPPIVYKYRTWTDINHQNMLRNNELYLSSPADFNDPFDCRIPENFFLLDTSEKIKQYVDEVIARQSNNFIKDGVDVEHMRGKMLKDLNDNLDRVQLDHEKITFQNIDRNYGVLSLSGRWNNILMWSHYAQSHKGYCIGFHEEKLRNGTLFGRGGMVITPSDDNYPSIDPLDNDLMIKAVLQTQYKSQDWHYENEYRLTSLLYPGTPSVEDRKRFIPNDFIAEVIIGLQTPLKDKNEIITIAIDKKIKVYQAIKIPFKFKIEREQIA